MRGYYLHIPFCEKKCSYCDFYSLETTQHIDTFVETLLREITMRADTATSAPVTSVFFGGGTPSLLSIEALTRIAEHVRASVPVAPDAEWTMECNPGTVTAESLQGYAHAGINRLSFGVQSFTESELAFLDRIHTADEASLAMQLARQAGFANVNMDLMFAVPGQTFASLQYNIERLLALEPDHISAYSLIYEHGTPLYAKLKKGLVTPTSEDTDAAMYALVIDTLTRAGYEQYEVSNFARPGRRCLHNRTYWFCAPYTSVGPSAHGLLGTTRYWNHRSLTQWTAKVHAAELPEANRETLDTQEQLTEFLFCTLRAEGIPVDIIRDRFGIDIRQALGQHLAHWIEADFIRDTGAHLRLTAEGYRVCDELTLHMLACVE
jgi:oxygen-independent coproporphyrinogen-3 oxidase